MLFDRNDKIANEKTIYQTKPNMLLGCKKAILGVILLIVVLSIASPVIAFIGQMQVYLISYVKLSLTRYVAIALFVIILFIVLYIIWQLINWYYMEYILTDSRIIIKSGVLYTKKNYMPYGTIQDVSTSQSIIAKILNVGTVSVYSAYDNNQMKLANVSNVNEVENIIFSKISSQNNLRNDYRQQNDYYSDDEYYKKPYLDDSYYEPQNYYKKEPARDYEYYPEELNFEEEQRHNYEYEYYDSDDSLERDIEKIVNSQDNEFQNRSYYNESSDDYSYDDDYYYEENEGELYYNDEDIQDSKFAKEDITQTQDSKETIIKRHFDKFKK